MTARPLFIHPEATEPRRAAVRDEPDGMYLGTDGDLWPVGVCDVHWRPQTECGRDRCSGDE